MSGWQLILGITVVASGSLMFLRFVAIDLAMASAALVVLDELERKAYQRRMEQSEAEAFEEGDFDVVKH